MRMEGEQDQKVRGAKGKADTETCSCFTLLPHFFLKKNAEKMLKIYKNYTFLWGHFSCRFSVVAQRSRWGLWCPQKEWKESELTGLSDGPVVFCGQMSNLDRIPCRALVQLCSSFHERRTVAQWPRHPKTWWLWSFFVFVQSLFVGVLMQTNHCYTKKK